MCPEYVPKAPKFHPPFAFGHRGDFCVYGLPSSGGFFVAIALPSLYTDTCYAVTPCADTAHTPARVKELAAMRRLIVLTLLTFLCLALRASSRM